MLNSIQVMSDFAKDKAEAFFSDSQRIRKHQMFLVIALITIIVISSIVVGIVISKGVTNPISQIIEEIKEIAKGDFSRRVNIEGTAETGQLASEFNIMAAELNKSTTSIKNLNEEISRRKLLEQELNANNQQLHASEQQLRASNQQLSASEQQLKASNQQLNASEQQLRASNQQLRANEQERKDLLRTLASKNNELHSIVYISSHDLKSPLVNIQGFSARLNESCREIKAILKDSDVSDDILQRILPLTEEDIPESLKFISASADKMKVLLDGLLHVSRVGTADINIRPLDVSDVIDNVCKAMEFQIKEADVGVTIDDLPGCVGDAEMINQLFSNLIGNGLKYLDPDRKGKIHISGTVEDSHCIYCVEDNGIGIAPEHQPKVFELFHRLNPKDSVGGEGLGLTIVTRILDRLNGHIRVESEPERGSKFFVSLPTC